MTEENRTFRLLYVIGIILVVTSHTSGGGIYLFTDWFSENSFHMQLFLFASGYFYKTSNENYVIGYIIKKIKRLLIPCLTCNLFYGMFTSLLSYWGFAIGEKFSLFSWLISPFLFGSDFKFNSPDWFIAQLFIVEIINVLVRKVCCRKAHIDEKIVSCILIILGVFATYIGQNEELSTIPLLLCRTSFCLSWYTIGALYKMHEAHDKLCNSLYFGIIFALQLVLLILNEGNVAGSVVRFSFGIGSLQVYLAAALGIAFWLRICQIIADKFDESKMINYIGKHTLSIVENQYLGIFILNTLLLFIHKGTSEGIGFNEENYFTMHNYIFLYKGNRNFAILYLFVGLAIPLLLSFFKEKIVICLSHNLKRKTYGQLQK